MLTLDLMRSSVDRHLRKFITPQKAVTITILGSADAVPLRGVIPYSGEFGQQLVEDCQVDGQHRTMHVSTQTGITDNPTLAFMRSYAVGHYIAHRIEALQDTRNTFNYRATVSPHTGGRYRRVTIEMLVHNVFENVEQN